MRNPVFVLAILALLLASERTIAAEDAKAPSFLKSGDDYVLHFAGKSPFQQAEGIPLLRPINNGLETGRITASITYSVTIFTVVELSGHSWVLVEHPKSIKDAGKWNCKRFALAALTPQTIANLEATDDGKVKLGQLRKQAAVKIEADKTWINLNHVVAIAKPPTEPQDLELMPSVEQLD